LTRQEKENQQPILLLSIATFLITAASFLADLFAILEMFF